MNIKESKKAKLRKVVSPDPKHKVLNLALKYLREEASESESLDLVAQIEKNLKRKNQGLFDFLSAEIKKASVDLFENWMDFVGGLSTSDVGLISTQGHEMELQLFLIPVIVGARAECNGHDDFFEIAKLGKVRDLMVKAGLISDETENVTLLTELLSFDAIASMTETKKHQVLQFLTSCDPKYALLRSEMDPPTQLLSHAVDLRFKFILGCAQLKAGETPSPLMNLLCPSDDVSDEQLDVSVEAMFQFAKDLTENLPSFIKKKNQVEVCVTTVSSILEFSRAGILSAIEEYNQFKQSLLLARSSEMSHPRIKVSQSEPEFLNLDLFENDSFVEGIKVNSVCPTPEDMMSFLEDFYGSLEDYGFVLESDANEVLIFSKKEESKVSQRAPLRLLH